MSLIHFVDGILFRIRDSGIPYAETNGTSETNGTGTQKKIQKLKENERI